MVARLCNRNASGSLKVVRASGSTIAVSGLCEKSKKRDFIKVGSSKMLSCDNNDQRSLQAVQCCDTNSRRPRLSVVLILLLSILSAAHCQIPRFEPKEDSMRSPQSPTPILTLTDTLHPFANRFGSIPEPFNSFRGLVLEETEVVRYLPTLPYIYFDSASAIIPHRYVLFANFEQTRLFHEENIVGGVLEAYYHTLNILGSRLRQNPQMKIGIVGFNSDQPKFGENQTLSKRRGEVVYDYLRGIWHIPTEQLVLLPPSILPRYVPTRTTAQVKAQYRCVELVVGTMISWKMSKQGFPTQYDGFNPEDRMSWEGRKPVCTTSLQIIAHPAVVRFSLNNGINDTLVRNRVIEIRRNGQIWNVLSDSALNVGEVQYDWMNQQRDRLATRDDEYVAQLVVWDRFGTMRRSNEIRIPVRYVSQEFASSVLNIRRSLFTTSLVLIPSDGEEHIGSLNPLILLNIVCSNISSESRIDIVGHAALSSSSGHNLLVSDQWAKTAYFLIRRSLRTDTSMLHSNGVGDTDVLYSGGTPEERMYNHSVEITVDASEVGR